MSSHPSPRSRIARLARAALPAAPLVIAAAPTAKAVIIYTDLGAGVTISNGGAIFFNLDHAHGSGSGNGVNSYVGSVNFSGADFAFSINSYGSYVARAGASSSYRIATNGSSGPANFAFNADISTGNFSFTGASLNLTNGGSFTSGTSGYIGLRDNNGGFHYGWAYITYNTGSITLYGFAYEDSGATILAGATGAIPEPATTAALAALLAGSAALWRRRTQKKTAPAVA